MKRFDGNSVLVVEADHNFGVSLFCNLEARGANTSLVAHFNEAIKLMEAQDFDLVICSYYHPDGLIHHLIDWYKKKPDRMPVFVALGESLHSDPAVLKQHLISGLFLKGDIDQMLSKIHYLLFDFQEFRESLKSLVEDRGIVSELLINEKKVKVKALEIDVEGMLISTEEDVEFSPVGLLRISFFDANNVENMVFSGTLDLKNPQTFYFKFGHKHSKSWCSFMLKLEEKQNKISSFLKKAAGA